MSNEETEVPDDDGLIVDTVIYRNATNLVLQDSVLVGKILDFMDNQDSRVRAGLPPSGTEMSNLISLSDQIIQIGFPDRTFQEHLKFQSTFMIMRLVKSINDSSSGKE